LPGRIDTFLKLSIIASAFMVAASAAYYYLVFLPQRDAQLIMERKLERAGVEALRREQAARAEAEKSAARERMLSERREEREAAKKAAAQSRHQMCLDRAQEGYSASWAVACKRIAVQAAKDYTECTSSMGLSKEVCDKTYPDRHASSTCGLPHAIKTDLTANLEKARDRCSQENKMGLQ
jgi:hypothetical protein